MKRDKIQLIHNMKWFLFQLLLFLTTSLSLFNCGKGYLGNGTNDVQKEALDQKGSNLQQQIFEEFLPNDPLFTGNQQWGFKNSGQNIKGITGLSGNDVNVAKAWSITTGTPEVIVAILDTGIDLDHTDLKQNIWINTREIPANNLDDDNNGYIDDINGWNFYSGNNNPSDENFHGTHVAGIIAGSGNNNYGIAGIAWNIKIMAVKIFGPTGSMQENSDPAFHNAVIVKALKYAMDNGARIINNSTNWSYTAKNDAQIAEVLVQLEQKNILLITAAGNSPRDIDVLPIYPASLKNENIITVAAINAAGELNHMSSYGPTSVDIAAPGEEILSTFPSITGKEFDNLSGTSQAAPFVSGQAALITSLKPGLSAVQIKQCILNSATSMDSLKNKILTGGRINIYQSLLTASGM